MMGPKPPGMPSRHSAKRGASAKPKDAAGTFRRLLKYFRGHFAKLTAVFVTTLLAAAITISGIRLNGIAIDQFILKGDLAGLLVLLTVMAILYTLHLAATYWQNLLMIDFAQKIAAKLREDLFAHLLKLPLAFFDSHSRGDLMSRLTNDIDNINAALSQSVPQFFSGIISTIGVFLAMVFLSPALTLAAMALVPLLFLLSKTIVRFSRRYFSQYQKSLGALNGCIEETLSGQKTVLLFGQEETVKKEFQKANERLRQNFALAQTFSAMGPFTAFINNLIYVLITLIGAYLILQGQLTVGVVFAFLLYLRNFAKPLNSLAGVFNTIQSALAGAEQVFAIIDEPPERDTPKARALSKPKGEIAAKDLTFAYADQSPVLKNLSFTIRAGETAAIVGATGVGKTTIISLLSGFYQKESGTLTIDGIAVDNITRQSLRRSMGVVLQDTFLFNDSIMENIRYGCPAASDSAVIAAAKSAGAHQFIEQLKDGYQTLLAENGQNLAHGQRQQIAIARAILSDPAILILDEATASIDTRTEQQLQNALARLMRNRTNIIIAHRLSTIKNADQILFVADGQIVEQGTHRQLLAANGRYAKLFYSQFAES